MYNWNQFRNFPKFKDMSAQEQARQYFLYQSNIMMEQSAAAIAPAAAAAAGAGAGGGGGKITAKEDFGQYRTSKAIYFDTMGGDNAPTSEELLGYAANGTAEEEDKQTNYRFGRNAYSTAIYNYDLRQYEQPNNGDIRPEPTYHSDYGTYSTGSIFFKGAIKTINQTWWAGALEIDKNITFYGSQLDQFYETWSTPENLLSYWTNPESGLSASSIWPGVSEIKVLPAVASSGDLPLTGNPGEIIGLSASDVVATWYAWDPIEEEFSESVFNNYINAFFDFRGAKRDANIKALNELSLAISPFLWAANYIPSYWVRKELYDSQPGNYPG